MLKNHIIKLYLKEMHYELYGNHNTIIKLPYLDYMTQKVISLTKQARDLQMHISFNGSEND